MSMFQSAPIVFVWLLLAGAIPAHDQASKFPVKALCIAAPGPRSVERFNRFIVEQLAPRGVNTLILRVDFNYQFKKHPELISGRALSAEQAASMVETCQRLGIRLIPQVNLLGHQSWHENIGQLLKVYPEFDETPGVKLPKKYKWPNADGLYCKSYCPQHPKVHEVVFACVDEVCDAFKADAFHAGMDEVFYIGHPDCPRCQGQDRAKLFADEVNKIQKHLSQRNRELWIWGDRLIDGETTGIGEWEASTNQTHPAIDLISRDVVICDWHYERAHKTPVLFAAKGFRVVTSVWRNPNVSKQQVLDMVQFRRDTTLKMRDRYQGMMQTVWGSAEGFMDKIKSATSQNESSPPSEKRLSAVENFMQMFQLMKNLESGSEQLP